MYAIETTGLTKDYAVGFWRKRRRCALDQLNLKVEAGEIFGLLGPNGAGKSTTFKLLFRFIFPTSGSAKILGRDLGSFSADRRVGYLPENPSFYDHLTAEEFLELAARLFGLSRSEGKRRAGALIERVRLENAREVALRKFSKGMTQRLGIAQALINDPELIFLDEPMSGLDPIGRREVRNLILDLRGEGKTIFFSTHILSDAETLCDRVVILDRGKMLGMGELNNILAMEIPATELVLENPSARVLDVLKPYARAIVHTGNRMRMEFGGEHDAGSLLKKALASGAEIISFNPVKLSLEDYFMAQLCAPRTPSAAPSPMEETYDSPHFDDRAAHV
ncbi:MAG: ATP-binding cassette domain-containing protein [Terriglobia bacterium]